MISCPFTGGKDPALHLTHNLCSESFFPYQQVKLSKLMYPCFRGQEGQKTIANTKDSPAVNLECFLDFLRIFGLFLV